jgi:hypothetical protein
MNMAFFQNRRTSQSPNDSWPLLDSTCDSFDDAQHHAKMIACHRVIAPQG